MTQGRKVLAAFLFLLLSALPAAAWEITDDIIRLYKEAPSIEAYPGVEGVVWMDQHRYELNPDGTMEHIRRYLRLNGRQSAGDDRSFLVPLPMGAADVRVTSAAFYNPMTGRKEGDLRSETPDTAGFKSIVIPYPSASEGRVIAIETRAKDSRANYLDGALFLAGPLPIWEQSVIIDMPSGMDVYWQGTGIKEPVRRTYNGRDSVTWSVTNTPIWTGEGVVDAPRPAIVFSLRKGLVPGLRSVRESLPQTFLAPPLPDMSAATRRNLQKTGEAIVGYLEGRGINVPGFTTREMGVRNPLPESGWTPWERTLIAAKWFEGLGFKADVYWRQAIPTPDDGPAAMAVWSDPVLVIRENEGGGDPYFYLPNSGAGFAPATASLFGTTLYMLKGSGFDKLQIPSGHASDHPLALNWKLAMNDQGIASGTLDITYRGGWESIIDMAELTRLNDDQALDRFLSGFNVSIPGLQLAPVKVEHTDSGFRARFNAKAALGIVSGNGILLRLPSLTPKTFEEMRTAGETFGLRFPFTLEHRVDISTPSGYRAIESKVSDKTGDKNALFEESTFHWPRRRQLEAQVKWTVRSTEVDPDLARKMLTQLNSYARWLQTTLPLRKK